MATHQISRALAITKARTGHPYLAVLTARLVAMTVITSRSHQDKSGKT